MMVQILVAWLLGAALGAFAVQQTHGRKLLLYERWYCELKKIIEEHYGGRVEDDTKTEVLIFRP